jgi:hypothetical protein
MRAKTSITANTARKKEQCVAFVNDDFENARRVKYWEIIADRVSKAGWSLGWVTAVDSQGRTIRSRRLFTFRQARTFQISSLLPEARPSTRNTMVDL